MAAQRRSSKESTDERRPLLDRTASTCSSPSESTPSIHRKVILLMCLIIVTLNVAAYLQSIPRVRLYEIVYCRQYYQEVNPGLIGPGGVVDEKLCKINAVQNQVALLIGWLRAFDYAPGMEKLLFEMLAIRWMLILSGIIGIFLAVPFGMLADKYGRKWLLMLDVVAICLRQSWFYFIRESLLQLPKFCTCRGS